MDAPSASPLAFVASPSAMPPPVVMRASELPICSICFALRRRGQLDLAGLRLGDRDARDALGLGLDLLLVGGGVGGLADLGVQALLLALGLELRDRGLLDDDLLARLGVGERAGLGGHRGLLVDLAPGRRRA